MLQQRVVYMKDGIENNEWIRDGIEQYVLEIKLDSNQNPDMA